MNSSRPERARILVDAGTYDYANLGDTAMLRVAVRRLRELRPDAGIGVFTEAPDRLRELCPDAIPLAYPARSFWLSDQDLIGGFQRRLPGPLRAGLAGLKRAARRRAPGALEAFLRARLWAGGKGLADWNRFMAALDGAELLLVAGTGGFTDHARLWSLGVLALIDEALRRRIPVAMSGQGMGPLSDPDLLAKSRKVLPRVSWIFAREGGKTTRLLRELGVPEERVRVTGDDAIETAWNLTPRGLGASLGVNVRIARSAGTDEALLDGLRPAVRRLRETLRCEAVAVPIGIPGDATAIARLIGTSEPAALPSREEDVIAAAGRCRVLLTGAYHAAVFALSQGVPAVCLAGSPYFADKLEGLAEQFPGGVSVLSTRSADLSAEVEAAVLQAWSEAPRLRDRLLAAASAQIRQGRDAYALLPSLTAASAPRPSPRAAAGGARA